MRFWSFVLMGLFVARTASAQITVQQPVVSQTGVSTTVSVPDRGQVFLGGVSSAQSGRIQNGPIPTMTSRGFSRQATSISTSVYIHDMQAMDEAILNTPSSEAANPNSTTRTHASNLEARLKLRRAAERESMPLEPEDSGAKAAKFEQLALKAEKAGKAGVAKLHWQVAAKYGSKQAELRLAQR